MSQHSFALASLLSLFLAACSPKSAAPSNEDLVAVLATHKLVDEHGINGVRDLAPIGRLVFAVPRSQFAIPVSGEPRSLGFEFGLVDTARIANPPTDGVSFRVLSVDGSGRSVQLWARELRPVTVETDRGIQRASVTIPSSAKQVIFETLPVGDVVTAWSYWTGLSLK